MKKIPILIVAVAVAAAYVAHRPTPPVPSGAAGTSLPSAPLPSVVETPAPVVPPAPVQPSDASSALFTGAVARTPAAPPAAGTTAEVASKDLGDDPPDVLAKRPVASASAVASAVASSSVASTRMLPGPVAASGLMMKADRDGERNGCKAGDLLLDGSGVHFSCPADSAKSVALALAEIKEVNKSGVEARNGHKYHFHIENSDEQRSEALFQSWLNHARSTAN